MSSPHDVLTFWFGSTTLDAACTPERRQRWFAGGPALDDEIRERFGATVEQALAGELDGWARTVDGWLALIVVLDQFPRNIHRGTAAAFAGDAQAQALCLSLHAAGEDAGLGLEQRMFAAMPLQHAESLPLQRQAVVVAARMLRSASPEQRDFAENLLGYALQHHDIVEQFGRFPHRNAAMGRPTTAAEAAWLAADGTSFGQ